MPTKKIAPPLAALPALRTIRQRPARVAPPLTAQFQWYTCCKSGAFVHLLLLDGPTPLAHWVLPAVQPTTQPAHLQAGLWLQVPPSAEAPTPPAEAQVQQGTCYVVGHAPAPAPTGLPAALHTGRLMLHLPTSAGTAETYTLVQLRPDGSGWLLSRVAHPTRG